MANDCWSKGGGKEGQGPKGRKKGKKGGHKANQAEETNSTNLNNCAYMVSEPHTTSKMDWLLDSGTTSHICTVREAFTSFQHTTGETLKGVGPKGPAIKRRGTVKIKFEFDGQITYHTLQQTLYVPDAPNCLLSISRFDENGGRVEVEGGVCWMKDKAGKVVGKGWKRQRLYPLAARTEIPSQESANLAMTKLTWDQWHKRYGHIGITALR
jgi:hypothetical protein